MSSIRSMKQGEKWQPISSKTCVSSLIRFYQDGIIAPFPQLLRSVQVKKFLFLKKLSKSFSSIQTNPYVHDLGKLVGRIGLAPFHFFSHHRVFNNLQPHGAYVLNSCLFLYTTKLKNRDLKKIFSYQ